LSEGILNPGSKTGSARSRALSPGRAERHGFQYYRHGTLSLYAALDVKTGRVEGHTAKRDTSAEFLVFLRGLLRKARWAREIHIVLWNTQSFLYTSNDEDAYARSVFLDRSYARHNQIEQVTRAHASLQHVNHFLNSEPGLFSSSREFLNSPDENRLL
jgi:DDE superfamily endonuclease